MVRGAFGFRLPRLFIRAFIAVASRRSAPADAAEPGALLGAAARAPGLPPRGWERWVGRGRVGSPPKKGALPGMPVGLSPASRSPLQRA